MTQISINVCKEKCEKIQNPQIKVHQRLYKIKQKETKIK